MHSKGSSLLTHVKLSSFLKVFNVPQKPTQTAKNDAGDFGRVTEFMKRLVVGREDESRIQRRLGSKEKLRAGIVGDF